MMVFLEPCRGVAQKWLKDMGDHPPSPTVENGQDWLWREAH
jgi:hypothetical protein